MESRRLNTTVYDSEINISDRIADGPVFRVAVSTSPRAALATSPNVQNDSEGNIALSGATAKMVGFSVDEISTANVETFTAQRRKSSVIVILLLVSKYLD